MKIHIKPLCLAQSLAFVPFQNVASLSTPNRPISKQRAVVVGKVIVDDYQQELDQSHESLSIGGGGPQAAFGAAAALAVLGMDAEEDPPRQPVTFLGPIGKLDWTARENDALHKMLDPMIDSISLVEAPSLRTPRIQLWHDSDQNIQWKPLYGSFGPEGADGLWRNRPSAADVASSLDEHETISSLHVIIEVGENSPGAGQDSMLLRDRYLIEKAKVVGIEPIAFPDDKTSEISTADCDSCFSRLEELSTAFDIISPDEHLYRALDREYWKKWDVAVRCGPEGSFVRPRGSVTTSAVPAAKLLCRDGSPVNPTGAGNAYAAAMTTCIGTGVSLIDSGCIASAIGAVVCEHDHLPPWSAATIKRIRQAAAEVKERQCIHKK